MADQTDISQFIPEVAPDASSAQISQAAFEVGANASEAQTSQAIIEAGVDASETQVSQVTVEAGANASEVSISQLTIELSLGPAVTPPTTCPPTQPDTNLRPRVQRVLDFSQEIQRNIQYQISSVAPLTLYGYSMEWIPISVSELINQRNAYGGSIVFPNYGSFYFAYIAHISTEDIVWSVAVDGGIPDVYIIPHGSGIYQKTWVIMKAKKGKVWDWTFSSTTEFQLIVEQSFVKSKQWSSSGAYEDRQLFGDITI